MAEPEDGLNSTMPSAPPIKAGAGAGSCPATSPLGWALFRVMRAVLFSERPVPELEALPLAQMRLLMAVHHRPDATMKDWSERLDVSQPTVTQLADRLVRRGLLERVTDAEDRRIVRLHTSVKGRQLLEEDDRLKRHTLDAIWNALSPEAQQEALRGLETLAETAEAVREAQGRPLPAWPEKAAWGEGSRQDDSDPAQPVVDLMTRRIRGRATP